MQAVAGSIRCGAAAAVQQGGARRSLGGRQLQRAAANGARCRAFFKFGGAQQATDKSGRDLGISVDQRGC